MKTTQEYIIGDALELLPYIPDKYINLILSDLPYGTTSNKWDTIIPIEPLWNQYKRIIKDDGVIVLTSNQPFTSLLITSNIHMYKYMWTWDKILPTCHLNAKIQPLRVTEDIIVFYNKCCKYNPQMTVGSPCHIRGNTPHKTTVYGKFNPAETKGCLKYPTNLIRIQRVKNTLHSNQKPTELFEYLIKTYTSEGDTIHDSTMGSGVTMEASKNLNRNFIGFELNPEYEKYYEQILSGKSLEEIYYLND